MSSRRWCAGHRRDRYSGGWSRGAVTESRRRGTPLARARPSGSRRPTDIALGQAQVGIGPVAHDLESLLPRQTRRQAVGALAEARVGRDDGRADRLVGRIQQHEAGTWPHRVTQAVPAGRPACWSSSARVASQPRRRPDLRPSVTAGAEVGGVVDRARGQQLPSAAWSQALSPWWPRSRATIERSIAW